MSPSKPQADASPGHRPLAAITRHPQGTLLRLHIQPNAKRTELCGMHGAALKVRIASPPVDGRANTALLAFLAHALGVPLRQLSLLHGESSREKQVLANGLTPEDVARHLGLPS